MQIGIIEAPTVKQLFVEKITGMIMNNEIKPGDRLPSERELASQAHISRSAVHLGMSDLERMGFVETRGRQGTYVADFAKKGNIETLNLLIKFNGAGFDKNRVRDLLEMRMAIEGKALERLQNNLKEEDIHILEEDIKKAEQIEDPSDLASAFFDFHHDICVASGNFILPLLFNTFEYVTLAYWEEAIHKLGKEKCISLMKGLFQTILQRDASASREYLEKEFTLFLNSIS